MGFFNSLSIRITLALIGGILYGLLTHALVLTLDLPPQAAIGAVLFVFLLYLSSRLLILFSGIDTPYYSRERKGLPYENTAFYQTAQWVGKFYHYHDLVLFCFLTLVSVLFLASLLMDGLGNKPFGETIRNLWAALTLLF
ncbi:MAG: hypothetical protein FJ110_07235 [Deltaproteobacteria bacterium]|nr:hypothetical protein [Deltaproteobacteria bacterium]